MTHPIQDDPEAHRPPAGASSGRGKAFLHVGLPKTGTSFLQSHLWDSPSQLAAVGVRMVPDGRGESFTLMRAVRGQLDAEGKAGRAGRSVDGLRSLVEAATEPTLLLSQESLGGAEPEQAGQLIGCFADREVHVVVTARDVARQLPSAWQQRVKAKGDITFAEYLAAVRANEGPGKTFWGTQDLVATLESWGSHLPADRVHVVLVPPRTADRNLLAERFGSVVGVDFNTLVAEDLRPNYSLDPAQVELVRRVNKAHGLSSRVEHARTVKQFFSAQVLAPRRGPSAQTPADMADWCLELAHKQVAFIEERGFRVVGDLQELLPREEDLGPALHDVTDSEVAAAAVPAIADLLTRHNEREAELARLRADNEKLTAALADVREESSPGLVRGVAGSVEGVLGKVRRRRSPRS